MDKVWLVVGATGQYEDHSYWNVGFFETEVSAQSCVEFLTELLHLAEEGLYVDLNEPMNYGRRSEMEIFMKQFDPYFSIDYGGTKYTSIPVSKGNDFSTMQLTEEKIKMFRDLAKKEFESEYSGDEYEKEDAV